jgi:hypothetical protein
VLGLDPAQVGLLGEGNTEIKAALRVEEVFVTGLIR